MLLINPLAFLNALIAGFLPELMPYLSSGGGSDSLSISDILTQAGQVFTWFITQMTALVGFITANPAILLMFMVLLSGAVIGMFNRVWRSV